MSAADDPTVAAPPPPPGTGPAPCPRCGAAVRPDQDWCLNCGTAVTTEVAGAPGWRAPIVVVMAALLIAAGALVFAFLQTSKDDEQLAQAPAGTPAAVTTPAPTPPPAATPAPGSVTGPTGPTGPTGGTAPTSPGSTPGTSPTPATGGTATPSPSGGGTVASWPAGRTAWTVILFSGEDRAEAEAKARSFQAQGKSVGVLQSGDYSSLRPGYWVVFSGQYETQDEAQTAAEGFGSSAPGAYARQVKPK